MDDVNHQIDQVSAEELRDVLSSCSAFIGFSEREYGLLAQKAQRVFVPSGTQLVKFGAELDTFMIVEHGRFLFRIPSRLGKTIVVEVGRGQPLGLATSISRVPTLGEAYALRDSKVIYCPRKAFLDCFAANTDLLEDFSKWTLEQFLILIGQKNLESHPLTFALFPVSNEPIIKSSVTFLKQALTETIGKGHLLESQKVEKALHCDLTDDSSFEHVRPKLSQWLEDQESEGHYLLFVCDPENTKWTRWCLDQTDRIIVIARAQDTSAIERIDSFFSGRMIAGDRVYIDLVLIQDHNVILPKKSSAWRELKCLARQHHVRDTKSSDYQRVSRWIGEKPIGLTLGGGGARGLAHIGVLQALEERGVPIDAVGGTSMGAVIAGAYARGWSPQKILSFAKELFADTKAIADLDIPIVSILAGRKLNKKLRAFFTDIDITDLWLPYFCISASLSAGEMIVHDHGPLWKAVRASCSIPGVFPPVRHEGHLLVDGGVMNNVPLDVMESRCKGGKVIAVNVGGGGAKDFANSSHWDHSGWKLLRESFTSRNKHIANILDVMMWSTTLSSKRYLQQLVTSGRGDLYLAPPVQSFELLGFDALEQLYQVGYEYACKKLDEWNGLQDLPPEAHSRN